MPNTPSHVLASMIDVDVNFPEVLCLSVCLTEMKKVKMFRGQCEKNTFRYTVSD